MADVIFVAIICAFFALCVVYIRWCDRVIGPDQFTADDDTDDVGIAVATDSAPNSAPPSEVLV